MRHGRAVRARAGIAAANARGVEEAAAAHRRIRRPREGRRKHGSAAGYQNEVHENAWAFPDAPLGMRAFLGGQLNEDGIQFRWVAPTTLYWALGAELGRGRAFPASLSEGGKNGAASLNFFTHLGG